MLTIRVPAEELYDEETNEFYTTKETVLRMEHSLISMAKWEARWKKAFLTKRKRTAEETLDYFRCMTINEVDPSVYDRLTTENVEEILTYINEPMTAVYMGDPTSDGESKGGMRDVITAEVLYYDMTALNIPFECEKWHVNRLLALIHVCQIKNNPNKKTMSKAQISRRNAKLNAARRKAHNTKG